jgi:hypothetical protein
MKITTALESLPFQYIVIVGLELQLKQVSSGLIGITSANTWEVISNSIKARILIGKSSIELGSNDTDLVSYWIGINHRTLVSI